jgi:predicted dehydrogenase
VVIASPTGTHADLARNALMAGKHVVVDKPFTLTLAEARDLALLAGEKNLHLLVFHNRRWDTCFLSVRDAIERGEIGRVTQFASHFDRFRPEVRERWRESGGPGSGVFYDLAPHLVDQALVLFGRPEAVSADVAILREGGMADDYAQVTLRYPQMRVHLSASLNAPAGDAGGARVSPSAARRARWSSGYSIRRRRNWSRACAPVTPDGVMMPIRCAFMMRRGSKPSAPP